MVRFALKYAAGLAVLVAVDGALLTGIAALVTAVGGTVLGFASFFYGLHMSKDREEVRQLKAENRRLKAELSRRRRAKG